MSAINGTPPAPLSKPSAQKPRMSTARRREAIEGYLFLLPNFLGFVIFFLIPLALSFYYSLTDFNLFQDPNFVGLANYQKALGFTLEPQMFQETLDKGKGFFAALASIFDTNDPLFWTALGNTFVYALGVLIISVPTGFMLAWLLNSKLRGMTIFRSLFYVPVVAAVVGVALVWFWIYDSKSGALNGIITGSLSYVNPLFMSLGLTKIQDPNINWLTSPDWAMLSLIIMTSWQTIGYDMVIVLAALQGIPNYVFEAAYVDGASRWRTLRSIVIPLLAPAIFFIIVTNTIVILQVFAEPYIMTQGGPANSTLTIVYYLYQKGFQRFQMGYGAALAWIVFGIIFVITTIQFRISNRFQVE